jgi:hypothetical protein
MVGQEEVWILLPDWRVGDRNAARMESIVERRRLVYEEPSHRGVVKNLIQKMSGSGVQREVVALRRRLLGTLMLEN